MEVLKQNRSTPIPVEKQVAILYAVINDYLGRIEVTEIHDFEEGFYQFLDTNAAGLAAMQSIRSTGAMDQKAEENLKAALEEYLEIFQKAR